MQVDAVCLKRGLEALSLLWLAPEAGGELTGREARPLRSEFVRKAGRGGSQEVCRSQEEEDGVGWVSLGR